MRLRLVMTALMVVVLSVSFVIPEEDVLDTAFDESESLVFVRTISVVSALITTLHEDGVELLIARDSASPLALLGPPSAEAVLLRSFPVSLRC